MCLAKKGLNGERQGLETDLIVSIIVPVYHGTQYIKNMILQAEACKDNVKRPVNLELLLVNDAPDETINGREYQSGKIALHIFNTGINRGIHGARVWGLSRAKGGYILFLDQDDKVAPDYIRSQLETIGDADAAVCRCFHEGKQFYNADFRFEDAVTKEYMMTKGNPIVSPGQVLIRRRSIPEVWTENIMKSNCADDYLLWLCMAARDARFALNQNLLFEHVVDGRNLSIDYNHVTESEQEMYGILAGRKVFGEEDLGKISMMMRQAVCGRTALLVKFRKMFMVLNRLISCREKGYPVGRYLDKRGIKKAAVYGDGYIGKRLMGELREYGIEVVFFIDRNAGYLEEDVPVYRLEDAPADTDAVIISMVQGYEEVRERLREKYGSGVWAVSEIIGEIENCLI